MLPFLIACGWTAGVAWLLGRAVRQFRRYRTLQAEPDGTRKRDLPDLTVVVPARDEAGCIERCLDGLLAQDYPGQLRVFVVDDNSTDDTAGRVERVAARDPRVRLLPGRPLPPGWTGKAHACWQGAAAADSDWLCFLDADTAPRPALLRTAVATAEHEKIDLLSLEPFLELGSFWERLVIPTGLFLIAFTQNPTAVNDPARPEATADGQFLLFRRAAYEAVGGFAAVRDAVSEDKALARAVKRAGFSLALMGGDELIRVRMYPGLAALTEGLAKNVVDMAGGAAAALGAAALALVLGWAPVVVPLWVARGHAAGVKGAAAPIVAAAGSLALLGAHLAGTRHFRIPLRYGLLFPLGYTLAAGLAVYGVLRHVRGAVFWKGRVYAPAGR